MENEVGILSKQYVCEHGTDFDEKLWFSSYSDEVLDHPEDEGGKPFTGLAYELYDNGNFVYYCYYKNGFSEGNYVEFYHNGNLKSQCYMVRGQIRGTEKIWYDSGERKYEGEFKYGVCLNYTEWDKQGNIIKQKASPTKDDLEFINKFSESETHD